MSEKHKCFQCSVGVFIANYTGEFGFVKKLTMNRPLEPMLTSNATAILQFNFSAILLIKSL